MNKWLTVVLLVLIVLVGAMGLRNVVVKPQPAVADSGLPVPPTPWMVADSGLPVPPTPWSTGPVSHTPSKR